MIHLFTLSDSDIQSENIAPVGANQRVGSELNATCFETNDSLIQN